jgi:predicted branched-subunit amino acid permease
MFIYSVSIAPLFSEGPRWLRPILGYMLVDQNYASTMTAGRHREDVDVIAYYAGGGISLWIVWQIASIAGALLGPFIPAAWGLEFAVPLVFLAMLAPAMKDRTAVGVAIVTGIAAAVFVPLLPLQSGLIVAILTGMGYGAWMDRPKPGEGR